MADPVTITAEELEQLRAKAAQVDALQSERDHERNARAEESRRAENLSQQVNVDRRNLIGAQVSNFEAQANQAKSQVDALDSELTGYEDQIAGLNEEGKFKEAAQLSRKMADAAARRSQAQQAQAYFGQQAEQAKKQPADPIEAFFASNRGYNEGEREWIRKNPRYATDDSFRERANRAHAEFVNAGGDPGSTEYFAKLEQAGYMRQAPRPQQQPARTEKPADGEQTGGDGGTAGADASPLSEAAQETDANTGGQKVETTPRPSGAAAPSRRASPSTPLRGLNRKLTPDEADAALAMSEYFPEDIQNGGEASIYAYYADLKDNSPTAKRLREEWASR